ncbi:hypothetical protein ACQP2E_19415 [Actinoplanes sp. CA-015351]|uniref:hypothetical protein n=1 Tax=Actinoplanes sp. CA-015351 TaxID=3239897 RepID=UPI003D989A65
MPAPQLKKRRERRTPEVGAAAPARLEMEGLDSVVKAAVQRVVPGMRFTGAVDLRTGPGNARLVALR